jgi:hypothetical protein
MHRQRLLLAALLAAFIASNVALTPGQGTTAQAAAAAQKPSSTIDVSSTLYDFDATGAQLLMRSDDYNGISQATYTTIKAKGASFLVSSTITADGLWLLALSDQSGRTMWITPNQAIDSSQPAAPPAGHYAVQKAYSACRDQSGNIVPFPNLVNGSGTCSLAVNFSYGGILYKLLMIPGSLDGTLCPSGGCPPTGLAEVICNAASNNQCVDWTIRPNADAPLFGVANLYSYTGPRGSEWVYIGQYYNTFHINASNP